MVISKTWKILWQTAPVIRRLFWRKACELAAVVGRKMFMITPLVTGGRTKHCKRNHLQ